MSKISAVIIAKNEETMIEDAIRSLKFADNIIVIDNKSTDKTAEIAQKLGAKVYSSEINDFAKLRDFAKTKVKTTYILYIDADERVSTDLATEIKKVVKQNSEDIACYRLSRQNYYLGNNPWPYIEKLERMFRTNKLKKWSGKLHETAIYEGKPQDLDSLIFHYTHRNLTQMIEKTNIWSDIEAKNRYDSNHPPMVWWRFPRVMVSEFSNSYFSQGGWRAGTVGLIESIYQAFSIFITYSKLWELQQKNEKK